MLREHEGEASRRAVVALQQEKAQLDAERGAADAAQHAAQWTASLQLRSSGRHRTPPPVARPAPPDDNLVSVLYQKQRFVNSCSSSSPALRPPPQSALHTRFASPTTAVKPEPHVTNTPVNVAPVNVAYSPMRMMAARLQVPP